MLCFKYISHTTIWMCHRCISLLISSANNIHIKHNVVISGGAKELAASASPPLTPYAELHCYAMQAFYKYFKKQKHSHPQNS